MFVPLVHRTADHDVSTWGIVDSVNVDEILQTIPPIAVYLIVGGIIGLESLGIPLPGEIALVSAALLASRHTLDISPVAVGASATIGAIIGDTIGYSIGHRYGMSLFERLGNRFPKHFGPGHVALAKQLFHRWGVWAVFFGRFIALLRILAGPALGRLEDALPTFPGRQRKRRPVLGRRYHRRRLLPRLGRGAVAVEVFVDRASGGCSGRCRLDTVIAGTRRPRDR